MKFKLLFFTLIALSVHTVRADIVTSGLVNIEIPTDFDGVFVDIIDGTYFTTDDSDYSDSDVNFFFGGSGIGNSEDFQPVRDGTDNLDAIVNLELDDIVDASLVYSSGVGGSANDHIGTDLGQFEIGEIGYVGFALSVGESVYYGYMRVILGNSDTEGTILDWYYESSPGVGITVGAVPEPACYALGAGLIALLGVALRRHRYRV